MKTLQSHTLTIDPLGSTLAILILRLWLSLRSILTGIEKYAGLKESSSPTVINGVPDPNGMETVVYKKVYSLSSYEGVPASLYQKFAEEPLIPEKFLIYYDIILGPSLILLGLGVLLGIATRLSLLGMGLLYTSLTLGLILLNQSGGIAWLGTHIVLVALMLILAHRNCFELGNLIARRAGFHFLRNQ